MAMLPSPTWLQAVFQVLRCMNETVKKRAYARWLSDFSRNVEYVRLYSCMYELLSFYQHQVGAYLLHSLIFLP